MTTGSNFWVIGGEFGSMNFHKLVEGSAQVKGPFKTAQGGRGCLARGLGREPSQGRRALLDRGRALAGARPDGHQTKTSKDGRPHPVIRLGPLGF